MDWKQKNLVVYHLALVLWILVISSKKSFGNQTISRIHSGTSESYFIQQTSNVLTASAVLEDFAILPNVSTLHVSIRPQRSTSSSSVFLKLSSSETVHKGPNKTFIAEIRITNLNFSSDLGNETSPAFRETALAVTTAVNSIMTSELHYLGSQVISFREGSVIANLEIKMSPGSSSDPNIALDCLKIAVESGHIGNLTVDSTYFVGWRKKNPSPRKKLLYGQLAGIAVIFFIVVVLVLVICLGNFADEPMFQERELFSAELTVRNLVTGRDNEGNQENEWNYDPLFAWSHQRSFDSKL